MSWSCRETHSDSPLRCRARHFDDPRAGILEAANTPGDSDSLATLVGALLGARHGVVALPRAWVEEIERRDVFLRLAATVCDCLDAR